MSPISTRFRMAVSIIPLVFGSLSANVLADDLSAVISINKTALLSSERLYVLLSGTYTCGPLPQPQPTEGSTFASIGGSLRQASGREITQGDIYYQPLCDGQQQSFEVGVQPEYSPWHGGNARVQAELYIQQCNEFYECDTVRSETNVQIKIQGGGNN